MPRIILSPIFIVSLFVIAMQCWLLLHMRSTRIVRVACLLTISALFALACCGMPSINAFVYKSLEVDTSSACQVPQDAVVVLGGSYLPGRNASEDKVDGETALRLLKGIQEFKRCDARWLVLSGGAVGGVKERHSELTSRLALDLGVPEDHILIEAESRNTREHPIALWKTGLFGPEARLTIVSSPWHLKRAMSEFRRCFRRATPLSAYEMLTDDVASSFVNWLPQVGSLYLMTAMIQEHIGMLWYGLLRMFEVSGGSSVGHGAGNCAFVTHSG